MKRKLEGIRYFIFIGSFVGFTGLVLYPIAIRPLFNVDEYKDLRKRINIDKPNK